MKPELTTVEPLTNTQRLDRFNKKWSKVPGKRSLQDALDALDAQIESYNRSAEAVCEVPFETAH